MADIADQQQALKDTTQAENDKVQQLLDRHAQKLMDPDGRYVRALLPHIQGLGYDLVKIQRHAPQGNKGPLLQILAEPQDRSKRMGVEDCRNLSKTLSAILDVEDLFSGPFTLEVSSPGIDRPLTRYNDFKRFAGFEAKITIDPPAENGQKRFAGRIEKCLTDEDDGATPQIEITTDDGEEIVFDYERIAKAHLVFSDELMTATKDKIL